MFTLLLYAPVSSCLTSVTVNNLSPIRVRGGPELILDSNKHLFSPVCVRLGTVCANANVSIGSLGRSVSAVAALPVGSRPLVVCQIKTSNDARSTGLRSQ